MKIGTEQMVNERELLYDLLRFARDEFRDENGLPLSDAESACVQQWVDALSPESGDGSYLLSGSVCSVCSEPVAADTYVHAWPNGGGMHHVVR